MMILIRNIKKMREMNISGNKVTELVNKYYLEGTHINKDRCSFPPNSLNFFF